MTTGSFPTDAPEGLSITDTSRVFAGLITRDRDGNPRPGILTPLDAPLVTATNTMSYTVMPFNAVTTRIPGGIELVANDTTTNIPTKPAPAVNSRIDSVYVRSRFTTRGDRSSAPEIGVIHGDTGLNPTPGIVPPRAIELAHIRVPAGATSTDTGCVITQTASYTSLAGTPVPFRNLETLREWRTARPGQHARVTGTGDYEWDGATWTPHRPLMQHAEFTASLPYVDGVTTYPRFTPSPNNDSFTTIWHTGDPSRPGGLTIHTPGIYAITLLASHTIGMYGRSMLTIEDPETNTILARSNAAAGETHWSLSYPGFRTLTSNKHIALSTYKHDGTAEPGTFHLTIDRLF